MAESLRRVVYDATIDDAVDVSFRLGNRNRAFRRQIQQNIVAAGVAGGLIGFAALTYFIGIASLWGLLAVLASAVAFGLVFSWLFRKEFIKQIYRQQRKVVAEQFGGRLTLPSEVELRADAVWVRQADIEMLFPWSGCTGVIDNSEDVEMNFDLGICVVRNRHFAAPADRQAFLETARRLAGIGRTQDKQD